MTLDEALITKTACKLIYGECECIWDALNDDNQKYHTAAIFEVSGIVMMTKTLLDALKEGEEE